MLLEASNILNQEAYNDFYTPYMDRMNYNVTIQFDGSISILRVDLKHKPHLFRNKTDQCTCKEACVHELLLLYRFEASYYDNRWFFHDIVTCCRDIGNIKIVLFLNR